MIISGNITPNGGVSKHRSDWSQNDSTALDYVKNRTHYESEEIVNEPLNLIWDGSTAGRVSVNKYYKVSDCILTPSQFTSGSYTLSTGESYNTSTYYNKINDQVYYTGMGGNLIFVICADNANSNGVIFPEAGIYFTKSDAAYISSLTTTESVEHAKPIVKKLDKKYLPEDYINELIDAKLGVIENGTY